jgi:hypothetical protein
MAVRVPLYWDATNEEVREMTTAQITGVVQRMVYQYSLSPSVSVERIAAAGSMDAMDDTRMQAGAASSGTAAYVNEAGTADISQVTVSYDHLNLTTNGPADYPVDANRSYPVYWDSTAGEIRAMTQQDMLDTFVDPAIDYLVAGNSEATTTNKGGSFFISTSNAVTGATLVDASPVYIDTRADAAAYTSAGIPETLDQPTTINSYYLHRYDGDAAAGATVPLCIDTTGGLSDLRTVPDALWDDYLGTFVRKAAEVEVGYRVVYAVATNDSALATGTTAELCGSLMVDTRLNGSSATGYTTRFVNADDYRSQEFPNGTATTITSYGLYVVRATN